MLSKHEIYQTWAPSQVGWARWVKPVLFACMDGVLETLPTRTAAFRTDWVPAPGNAAIIADLPGVEGVFCGMQLARLGYRPIPLYNALPFPPKEKLVSPAFRTKSTVDVQPILAALYGETPSLAHIDLPSESPPVFLLDADRRVARRDPVAGLFDNRSVSFSTDFPSAEFMMAHGIHRVIVIRRDIPVAEDLLPTLLAWQKSGMEIFVRKPGDAGPPARAFLEEPSFLRSLWHRLSVVFGLRRGELGGFGGIVPSGSG